MRVLLIEDDPEYTALVRAMLAGRPENDFYAAPSLSQGLALIDALKFDVIVTDLNLPDSRGYETFGRLYRGAGDVPIVVLSGEDDEGIALRAVAEGAQDFLLKAQVQGSSLARAISYSVQRARARQSAAGRTPKAKVIGFAGAKGGVGTTTLAINVAAALSKSGKRTIAVELQPEPGGFSLYLPRVPAPNLGTLAAEFPGAIPAQALNSALWEMADGLRILCGPQTVAEGRGPDAEQAGDLIERLSDLADYVILDLPRWGETAAAALRKCSAVALVADREWSSLYAASKTLAFFASAGVNARGVAAALVNRTVLDSPVPVARAVAELGCELLGVIPPAAQLCNFSIEYRTPMTLLRPDDLPSQAYRELAERLSAAALIPISI